MNAKADQRCSRSPVRFVADLLLDVRHALRLLAQVAFQSGPGDALVLAFTLLTMTLIGLAGSALPARRALAVDPSRLMREE